MGDGVGISDAVCSRCQRQILGGSFRELLSEGKAALAKTSRKREPRRPRNQWVAPDSKSIRKKSATGADKEDYVTYCLNQDRLKKKIQLKFRGGEIWRGAQVRSSVFVSDSYEMESSERLRRNGRDLEGAWGGWDSRPPPSSASWSSREERRGGG